LHRVVHFIDEGERTIGMYCRLYRE
jgi:hypothetical protein